MFSALKIVDFLATDMASVCRRSFHLAYLPPTIDLLHANSTNGPDSDSKFMRNPPFTGFKFALWVKIILQILQPYLSEWKVKLRSKKGTMDSNSDLTFDSQSHWKS